MPWVFKGQSEIDSRLKDFSDGGMVRKTMSSGWGFDKTRVCSIGTQAASVNVDEVGPVLGLGGQTYQGLGGGLDLEYLIRKSRNAGIACMIRRMGSSDDGQGPVRTKICKTGQTMVAMARTDINLPVSSTYRKKGLCVFNIVIVVSDAQAVFLYSYRPGGVPFQLRM
jgi:hypothetical protein